MTGAAQARNAWLFVCLICVMLFSVMAWRIVEDRDLQVQTAHTTTANLARSLADKAHSTVHSATIILSGIVERLEHDGMPEAGSIRMHRLLQDRVANEQTLSDIVIVSAAGEGIATILEPTPKVNVADREYFIYHRDHPERMPHVGLPFRNRGEGRWSFPVTRRVDNADGSFGGVIVALIDCEVVGRFYQDFDLGPHGTIWLMSEDATFRQLPQSGRLPTRGARVRRKG